MKPAKKTDVELKRAETRFEKVSQLSGALVVIGLLIEVWGAVEYRPIGVSLAQTWEPAIAGLLVAGGVFFEIMFGRWALQQAGELRHRAEIALKEATERVSEANERAAALEKEAAEARERTAEIERVTVWRRLSEEQWVTLLRGIRRVANNLDVLIEFDSGDAEAYTFSLELLKVFVAAGVPSNQVRHGPTTWLGTVFGLMARALPPVNDALIKKAFWDAALTVAWMDVPVRAPEYLPRSTTPPNLYIFVAPKPPPPTRQIPKREQSI